MPTDGDALGPMGLIRWAVVSAVREAGTEGGLLVVSVRVCWTGVGMAGMEGGLMSVGKSVETEEGGLSRVASTSAGGGSFGAFCALIAVRIG